MPRFWKKAQDNVYESCKAVKIKCKLQWWPWVSEMIGPCDTSWGKLQSCNGAGLGAIHASGHIMGVTGLPKDVGGQMVSSNEPDIGLIQSFGIWHFSCCSWVLLWFDVSLIFYSSPLEQGYLFCAIEHEKYLAHVLILYRITVKSFQSQKNFWIPYQY